MSTIDKNIKKIETIIKKDISGLGILLSVEKIDLSLLDDTKNLTRVKGRNHDVVDTLTRFINQGNYDESGKYCPPIVVKTSDKYELVAGNHRFEAHLSAGKNYMLVGVVEFFSDLHKHRYQINENDNENDHYVKKPTSKDEISNIVLCLIKKNILPENKNDIENFVSDLKQLNHKKGKAKKKAVQQIVNEVLSKLNNKSFDYVHTYTHNNLLNKVSDTLQKVGQINQKNIVVKGFKALRDTDYDIRSFKSLIEILKSNMDNNNFDPVFLLSHVLGGADPSDVEEIRDFKHKHYLNDQIDFCRKVCHIDDHLKFKGMPNGIKDIVNLEFIPQLGDELSNVSLDEWLSQLK
jgi:hypothetical protein